MQKVYSDMDMQNNSLLNLSELTVDKLMSTMINSSKLMSTMINSSKLMSTMINSSNVYISQLFDAQNITADCTLIRCSGNIVIASGVTVNAIDSPSVTATGDGTLLRNGYAVGDFFIGEYSPAARAGGEWTAIAAGHTLVGSGVGSGYPVGATGGAETVTLTIEQIPNHSHEIIAQKNGIAQEYTYVAASVGGNAVYLDTVGAGGGQAHTNMPPYYVTNLWQRTA